MNEDQRSLITADRLKALEYLALISPKEGLGAEVGVYRGGSLKIIAEAMNPRMVYGFDTFTGLPSSKWNTTETHEPGDFNDTSEKEVLDLLGGAGLENVMLFSGIFPNSIINVERVWAKYAFVHIDVDFYQSTKDALAFFWPMMVPGGIVVLDDYGWPHCPGVEQALKEFSPGIPIRQIAKYQVFLVKE